MGQCLILRHEINIQETILARDIIYIQYSIPVLIRLFAAIVFFILTHTQLIFMSRPYCKSSIESRSQIAPSPL